MHPSIFPLCGHEEETLFHALVVHDHAKVFWKSTLDFFGLELPRLHPTTWSRDLLDPAFMRILRTTGKCYQNSVSN